jgi:hypothetical protein
VEVDFNAGTANAWPKLLSESTPTGTDCDVAAEYGRLLFDPDQDTEGSVMVCTSAGWTGGFTSFDIDGDNNSPQTITDGQEALFVGGVGIATTAAATDQVTFDFAYADTLAGNPAFNAKECVFVTEGTSGGGFLCEGTTANTNEYLFPALDGADTSTFIALGASDGDALAGDSATLFFDAGVIEAARLPDASLTAQGVVELATGAETNTGTDATRAVTPDGLDDWTGSAQVTTLGTIGTGTWQGTVIAEAYLPNASPTAEGVTELATAAEIDTGTDTGRTITPDALHHPRCTGRLQLRSSGHRDLHEQDLRRREHRQRPHNPVLYLYPSGGLYG